MKSEEEKKKDASTKQEHHGSGDNIAGDKNVYLPDEKIYPKFLTSNFPTFNSDNFVGRKSTLEKLHDLLEEGKKTLLLNGLGGIGKTSVAQMYCHTHEAHYDHFLWLSLTDSFENALTLATGLHQTLGIASTDEPKQIIANIFRTLNIISGNNLLIIDNADDSLKLYTDHLPPTWKVLVTSREKMDDRFTEYPLGVLDFEEAKLLFAQYFTKTTFTDEELKALCEEIGYHTLTLELLAKTLQESLELQTITELTQYLQDNRLDAEELQEEVFTQHSKEEREIYTHLIQAFTLAGLEEEEKWLLLQFAVLPPIAHEGKDFLSWIQKEDTRAYGNLLKKLTKKGWIERKNNSFGMHRLTQRLIRYQVEVSYENCKGLVDTFEGLLELDQSKDNPIDKFKWINYGVSLCSNIKENHMQIADLNNWTARSFWDRGNYLQSEMHLQKALFIAQKLNYSDSINEFNNNLGILYRNMGRYEDAAKLLKIALEDDLKNLGEEHPNVAVRQSNLANIYGSMGRYKEAIDLLDTALNFAKKNLGEGHPDVATRQSNLAIVYRKMGRYEDASNLLGMALASNLKNFGKGHPSVATNQSNLAVVFQKMGRYENAADLLENAIEFAKKNLGKSHPILATYLNNLAHVFLSTKEYQKAINHFEQAYSISLKIMGEEHPNTKRIKDDIENTKSLLK